MKKIDSRKAVSFVLIGMITCGIGLILYPTMSNWWNSFRQTKAIVSYTQSLQNLNDIDYSDLWSQAQEYNASLVTDENRWLLDPADKEAYNRNLNIGNDGIMAYIEIPSIGVNLPIYHGIEESVLQVALGHIPGSSLPIGGIGTHSVISGHRGLPSAKLFTDLDKVREGDLFYIHVLNESLVYQVNHISIVLPEEIQALNIDPNEDLFTLVTCTPYGVNTHRLLVQGKRIFETSEDISVNGDAMMLNSTIIALYAAIVLFILILVIYSIYSFKRKEGTYEK